MKILDFFKCLMYNENTQLLTLSQYAFLFLSMFQLLVSIFLKQSGIRRFYDNVRMMLGDVWIVKTLPYMVVCWTVLSPVFCLVSAILASLLRIEKSALSLSFGSECLFYSRHDAMQTKGLYSLA